jgi:hypothetical protein
MYNSEYFYQKYKKSNMHVNFDPGNVNWNGIFSGDKVAVEGGEDESDVMIGGNYSSAHYAPFSGMSYQRGAGVGSLFRSLYRFLLPLGKQAGAAIGRQGLESSARVLSSVLDGKELKHSLADEGKAGLKNLLDKASQNLSKQQEGSGASGGKFDFRRYKKNVENSSTKHGVGHVVGDSTIATTGVFTQPSEFIIEKKNNNGINKIGKRAIKYSQEQQLCSIIGPQSKIKRKISGAAPLASKKKVKQQKRLRIDSLGPY